MMQNKTVDSKVITLKLLFSEKFTVDYYQREYVWEKKQLEDLINDLSNAYLKCWKHEHTVQDVRSYDPYFMGEIVLSTKVNERSAIVDGQQRITTFTLLLIYLLHNYENLAGFPTSDVEKAIYADDFGILRFNLYIDNRKNCMLGLFKNGFYEPNENDKHYVQKIIERYNDIYECWNEKITNDNIIGFTYWLLEKVMFSKVWANSDDFAYIIFETMNDRGLSLTPVEMLRSYLLANIDETARDQSLKKFDEAVSRLSSIKMTSKSKAEFEFFKVFCRGHYAEELTQGKDNSDFVKIGNAFHRWVRENEELLKLNRSSDYVDLVNRIEYFSKKYEHIYKCMASRDAGKYFYLIVNSDYGFTLQPALILASIAFNDLDEVVEEKIQIVSKYLTKVLTWRVWNHWTISQSAMESPIYDLCKKIREMDLGKVKEIIDSNPLSTNTPELIGSPTLNHQNKRKLKVMLALITEIVARESKDPSYILNKDDIEVEHIWADHYNQHLDESITEDEFDNYRNNIGDLLLLPKSFNASYNDEPYEIKVEQYYGQNILAQTLNVRKYTNNPDFIRFMNTSELKFKAYETFKKDSIIERAELYKTILLWNWR